MAAKVIHKDGKVTSEDGVVVGVVRLLHVCAR